MLVSLLITIVTSACMARGVGVLGEEKSINYTTELFISH